MTTPVVCQSWNHVEPTEADQQYDLQLLTICGISVLGRWCGKLGEYYVGWAPLLGATRSQQQGYQSVMRGFIPLHDPQQPSVN
jgi:hypothetical protein